MKKSIKTNEKGLKSYITNVIQNCIIDIVLDTLKEITGPSFKVFLDELEDQKLQEMRLAVDQSGDCDDNNSDILFCDIYTKTEVDNDFILKKTEAKLKIPKVVESVLYAAFCAFFQN